MQTRPDAQPDSGRTSASKAPGVSGHPGAIGTPGAANTPDAPSDPGFPSEPSFTSAPSFTSEPREGRESAADRASTTAAAVTSTSTSTSASTSQTALALTDVRRHFGAGRQLVRAVDGVTLHVGRGEIVALLGPNGAGKTSLIDMVLGLSQPTEGTVSVFGEPPAQAVTHGTLSAVLQTGGLLGDLTVAETVEVIASFHRAAARVPEVLGRADLTHLARRPVGKCSGGEQQRIKFALALLPDPDLLILDEPTAGMDVTARRKFWDAMRRDAAAGRTVLFATHYLEEAEHFARRTVVLNHGRVVADGDTASLRAALGARTVVATLPAESPAAAALLRSLEADRLVARVELSGDRATIHTTDSDAVAHTLLSAGAHDLEISAPTLESAFTALTQD